jgi:hypothetical protein
MQFNYDGKLRTVACLSEWLQRDQCGVLRAIDLDKLEYRNFSNVKITNHRLLSSDESKQFNISKIPTNGMSQDVIHQIKESLAKTHKLFEELGILIAIKKREYTHEFTVKNDKMVILFKKDDSVLIRMDFLDNNNSNITVQATGNSFSGDWKEVIQYITGYLV